jgi:uncharacterized protein (TIGR00645 family)
VFESLLTESRAIVAVPIVALVLAAAGAFVYGAAVFIDGIREVLAHPFPVGNKIGIFLLVVDLFLIGATLLIAAIGFYELFFERIGREGGHRVPHWLQMHDLNDLKARVVSMIVLIVSVSFVEIVVDDFPGTEVLEIGGGIALVVAALTAFLRFGKERGEGPG